MVKTKYSTYEIHKFLYYILGIYKFLLSLRLFIYIISAKNWSYHWLKIIAGDWFKQIWSYRNVSFTLSQMDLTISCGWISFSKSYVCLEEYIFCIRKKLDKMILKVMIKNLYCCFCAKYQYSFILDYNIRVLEKRCEGGEWRGSK